MNRFALAVTVCALIAAVSSAAGAFECTSDSLVTLQAGIADDFAPPTEAVYPDSNHLLFITTVYGVPLRHLDDLATNMAMGHTFEWEPFEIVQAQLEIKLRCLNTLSANDRLSIEFNDNYFNGENENWRWTDEISVITGMPWTEYGEEATVVIDLVNPPPDYYGRTSIMPYLADGNLDVNVQDDTAVDYIVLRLCGGAPAPPELVSVTALSAEQIDVLFSEPLDPATAEDVSNYAVFESADPGSAVPVVNAALLADAVTVRLDFGSPLTMEVQYTLQASGVEDVSGNPMVSGEIEFIMEDAVPPVLLSAAVQSNLLIDAVFSEVLDPLTAEDEGNYELYELADPASMIAISGAALDGSGKVVALTLADPLLYDVTYVLRVNSVEDVAGNPVAPNSEITIYESDPPGMVSVTLEDMRTLLVVFDEPVSEATAEDAASYALHVTSQPSDIVIINAADLLIDGVTVRLTLLTALVHGTSYTLHADGVTDLVGNPVPPESTLEFVATDSYPPELVAVTPENALTVRVYFNEDVDAATAQTKSNYEIFETEDPSNTVAVTDAVRLTNGSSVRLSLDVYLAPDLDYTLRVSNVEDLVGNPIAVGSEEEFRYTGSSITGYIGLYVDAGHSENEVWAEGEFIPYNYYVWCLPSEYGMMCAEFAISYSGNVIPSTVTPNDDIISVSLGDLPGGVSVCFENCHSDWLWTHQQQFYVMNSEPGFIEVVPHPEAGTYQFANCLPGYPIEPVQLISTISINGEMGVIATLLHDFSATLRGDGIEVAWRLTECDEEIEFFVLRAEGNSNEFVELASPRIDRSDLMFTFTDESFENGTAYRYRVEYRVDGERRLLFETEPVETPELTLTLYQNAPNPFNPATTIRYYLPVATHVMLEVFDVSGRRVACPVNRRQDEGHYSVEWNGINDNGVPVSSGVYFYRLIADRQVLSRKMVLLR